MRKSQFSESQRQAIVAKLDAGHSLESICREHQISPATFYKWKRALSDQQDESRRELKQLREENNRLKKMYAELQIDHQILREGYEIAKKISAQPNKKR